MFKRLNIFHATYLTCVECLHTCTRCCMSWNMCRRVTYLKMVVSGCVSCINLCRVKLYFITFHDMFLIHILENIWRFIVRRINYMNFLWLARWHHSVFCLACEAEARHMYCLSVVVVGSGVYFCRVFLRLDHFLKK